MPGPASCLPASDTYNDKFLSHYALCDVQHNIRYDMSNVLMYSSNCETATNKRWCNTFHTHKKCNLAQVISSTEASHDETHNAGRCSPGSVTLTAHAQKEIMRRFIAKASSWGGNMTCCSALASVKAAQQIKRKDFLHKTNSWPRPQRQHVWMIILKISNARSSFWRLRKSSYMY